LAAPTLAIEAAGVISSAGQGEAAERLAAIAEKGVTLFASSTRATLPGLPRSWRSSARSNYRSYTR
jgi:hypothetical protein